MMRRVLAYTTLAPARYYIRWYVLEALRESGLGDQNLEQLAPWRGMLARWGAACAQRACVEMTPRGQSTWCLFRAHFQGVRALEIFKCSDPLNVRRLGSGRG